MINEGVFSLFFLSTFLTVGGAWLISKYGHRLDLLDQPTDRSSHCSATPKGGAVGILAAFVLVSLALNLPATFWLPAALLSIISFLGDRFEISPFIRLLFQFAASTVVVMGGWNIYPLLSNSSPLMVIGLSIYVVATANYYNFMDGINGITGITGFVGFGLLSFYCFYTGTSPKLIPLNISLALCCLAYLPFNIPEAKVFMGDTGSILLGFVFAAMVICLSTGLLDFICLASFLFPFYADELTTAFVRLKYGEKLWMPHRRHFYQLLANEHGIAHWKVSLGYGLGQLFVGLSVLYFMNAGLLSVFSIVILYCLIFTLVTGTIRKRLK